MRRFVVLIFSLCSFGVLAQPGTMPGMPIKSELDFIQSMIPHHQEAVNSALVVAKSERPELRAFAKEVIRVQKRELQTMQGWLEAWYPHRSKASGYTPMMRALPDATPNETDRAFIKDMVAHHEMAVEMARQFLAGDFAKRPEVEALARAIIATQTAEVKTLRGWLRDCCSDASTN